MFLGWFLLPLLLGIGQAAKGLLAVEGPLPSFYVTPTFLVLLLGNLVYDRRYLLLMFLRQEGRKWWDQLPSWPARRLRTVQPVDQLTLDHIRVTNHPPPFTNTEMYESTTQASHLSAGLYIQQSCQGDLHSITEDNSTVS